MKYGSLFSGIGGFDLGFERAGMTCAWQCEIDAHAREVLSNHFTTEIHNDVRTIGRNAGTVDLICGGFPCQDLSVAGKRAGLAGERSGLWFEFARVIDELEPRWVVIENVPGLLSSNRGADFAVILRWLVERGYGVCWRILDAQYFGVPQRRRRVFIVGSLGDGRAAEVLFEREGVSGDTPPSREAGKDVAYSLRSNPSHSGDKGDGGVNTTLVPDVANTLSGHNHRYNPTDGETFAVSGIGEYKDGIGTLRANGGDLGGGSEMLLAFMPRKTQMDVYEEVSPTMHAGGGGMGMPAIAQTLAGGSSLAHSDITSGQQDANVIPVAYGVRRLTPTECERLQGFPDGWTAGQSDTQRYKQLGNAVAVPCAEWIGRRIMEIES
jgi:DNA (cytosine-5)-methyltransferase 1